MMRALDRRSRTPLTALLLALHTLGCASTGGSTHLPADVPRERVGLPLIEERGEFLREWRKPGVDLGTYDRVLLIPLELVYTEQYTRNHRFDSIRWGRHWPPKARLERQRKEDLALMQRIFRETLESALKRHGGYALVDEPGPGVLSLSVGVVDLDLARSQAELNRRGLTAFDRIPTITISSSIRDGASAEHLGVMVQPSTNFGSLTKSGAGSSVWGTIRVAFDRWSRGFVSMLGAHAKSTARLPAGAETAPDPSGAAG
jgi:hypothetical protein